VQTFPATPHQLFLIPAATPHGSGEGNVVLEVSATPYLYSLRFYDWLRRDANGNQRPVHVGHAFANLDTKRRGERVASDLIQRPKVVRSGDGWREELLAALPEMFYDVRRWVLKPGCPTQDRTEGRFHVLNVVDGDGIVVEAPPDIRHELHYAETVVVPAAVGAYAIRPGGDRKVQVVKALVR
jgi:mannose-6-phosphate isomerase class I